jgi:hypothetical protein
MNKIIPASANEVRQFFADNPKHVPAGDKTVGKKPGEHRGKLSVPAREVFEKQTGKTYVSGTRNDLVALTFSYTQPSGRKATKTESLTVAEVRALAGEAAKAKGRLTDEAMEAARTERGRQVTEASKAAKKPSKPKAAKAAEAPVESSDAA